ncbi:MAG TPA: thiol:disulfide interchange protein DsbA/DsbL [Xanthomonadales bacterium]|nr:thiol:disulfide interchange protein DsbA/DsbL [Xanthomonadales bacterium]
MNKRFLTHKLASFTMLILSGLGLNSLALAEDAKYQDGVHYTLIENAPASQPGEVEVVEAFSYMCNHCATFEPYIQSWAKRLPESVKFVRYPVVFGRGTWELYARAYNTADVMGVADQAHAALMDKIWKEREVLKSMEELAEFYKGYGVDPEVFIATSKSFAVDAKMRREQRFLMDAGVASTPNMVVNGKYLVAGNAAVANYDQLLAVVDYLVAEELATHGAAATTSDAIEAAVEAKEDAMAEVTEATAAAEVAEEN